MTEVIVVMVIIMIVLPCALCALPSGGVCSFTDEEFAEVVLEAAE